MRAADLGRRRVAVWGLGREGRAAIGFLRRFHPDLELRLFDDDMPEPPPGFDRARCAFGAAAIAAALDEVEVIVKSPGVSLYRDEIRRAREMGVAVTSLINLWFAERYPIATLCITGTKGKSTTAALCAHILRQLGKRVALAGNIGVPITEIDGDSGVDLAVIEVSSYQAADFAHSCDIAVLTSLFPEHLDWHGSVERYYRDKVNLVRRGRTRIVAGAAAASVERLIGEQDPGLVCFGETRGLHAQGAEIFDAGRRLGTVSSPYLARPHNCADLCAALSIAKTLGIDPGEALAAAEGFVGLPHRQAELGEKGGVLYVDDSISTVPESTLAALAVYAGRDITVILGGYDRGLDYGALVAALRAGRAQRAVCLGASGARLAAALATAGCAVHRAASITEAVAWAKDATPAGGVVLLSPAAPSYGDYRDFAERGRDFAKNAGFAHAAAAEGR